MEVVGAALPENTDNSSEQQPEEGNVSNSRTIYVGNLASETTEDLLVALFSQLGVVKSCKLLKDNVDPYAFVEFDNQATAELAINTMKGRVCLDKKIKINWANPFMKSCTSRHRGSTKDCTEHYTVFVGDIHSNMSEKELQDAFSQFGSICCCNIVREPGTNKSRHYGFICFQTKETAENAIASMNGEWVCGRAIKTNWATRRNSEFDYNSRSQLQPQPSRASSVSKTHYFDEVSRSTSHSNTTIYVGNVTNGLTEELLREAFSRFGSIFKTRVFAAKGFGFVTFTRKSAAVQAIIEMDKTNIGGDWIRVAWAKEKDYYTNSNRNQGLFATPPNYGYGYHPNEPNSSVYYDAAQAGLNYWYQNLLQYPAAFMAQYQQQQPGLPATNNSYYPSQSQYGYGGPGFSNSYWGSGFGQRNVGTTVASTSDLQGTSSNSSFSR